MKHVAFAAAGVATLLSAAHATNIISPGDFAIAVNPNLNASASATPTASEVVSKLFDGIGTSKYLNTGGTGTGFIATPTSPFALQSFTMTTGGDAPDRDPTRYEIYGTNSAISSANQSAGTGEAWTLISSGPISLPATRGAVSSVVPVANATSYSSYKVVFPTNAGSNLVQVAEFSGFANPAGTGASAFLNATALAIDAPVSASRHPVAENPAAAINGIISTSDKYLNFGKDNSGLIVTPSSGASIAQTMTIWTGGDNLSFPGRSPTSYILFGTNDAISSYDNSTGTAENWSFIAGGNLAAPSGNLASYQAVFPNSTAYTSYKVLFPTIVGGSDSLAIAEFTLDTVPEPAAATLAGLLGLGMILRRRK
ncbi:MAG: hypothetical protein JWO82_3874 [Akkermansiaceae bacterium]|nr:hypothetical protein [Akkermansiaceae bacterium]